MHAHALQHTHGLQHTSFFWHIQCTQLTLNVSKEACVLMILHCRVCLSHLHTLVACFVPTNTTQKIENRGVPTDGRKCLKVTHRWDDCFCLRLPTDEIRGYRVTHRKLFLFECYPQMNVLLVSYPQTLVFVWVYPQKGISLQKHPNMRKKSFNSPVCEIKP